MKIATAVVASLFAVTAFAANHDKKDAPKAEAKPAAAAPAKDVKKDAPKSEPKAADKKAEAAKK